MFQSKALEVFSSPRYSQTTPDVLGTIEKMHTAEVNRNLRYDGLQCYTANPMGMKHFRES